MLYLIISHALILHISTVYVPQPASAPTTKPHHHEQSLEHFQLTHSLVHDSPPAMSYTKNYYHTLGLALPSPVSPLHRYTPADLRRAYRNALLCAHPDKQHTSGGASSTAGNESRGGGGVISVDDVREAYGVLSNQQSRAQYDEWVLRNPQILSTAADVSGTGMGKGQTLSADFVLGLEVLDLSDFEEVETGLEVEGGPERGHGAEAEWTRACRCGHDKGFRILEEDLVDAETRGEKEVLVGCGGCSLWVRVAFDVEEG